MKPAEQPLLDTYVPLPFKEMSMAYAVKQKEHTDAEELAGSLDDDLLKVRAVTPLHSRELGNIRTGLDTELKELVDKHGGRYADMVPELSKIKTRLDRDFRDGSLYSIQETTRLKGKLDKGIVKAEDSEKYSDLYSPRLGGERDFTNFYNQGMVSDGQGGTTWDTDPNVGWEYTGDGRKILSTYDYKGVHRGSDQTDIVNTQTFDKIKPDIQTWANENKGRLSKGEIRKVTLSKIYRAAHNAHTAYPDNFQEELDLITTGMMTPEQVYTSAANAIDNIYGSEPETDELTEARDEALEGLGTVEDPSADAYNWAKTAYVGSLGEKYLMSDTMYSDTFVGTKDSSGFGSIPRTDWVPIVEGETSMLLTGKPMTLDGTGFVADSKTPLHDYSKVIDSRRKVLIDVKDEYDRLVSSDIEMDDAYHTEWQEKINTAQYQYESSAFAMGNLLQQSAKSINAKRVGDVVTYSNFQKGKWVDGKGIGKAEGTVTVGSTEWNTGGWATIQWDENGLPFDPENVDYRQAVKLRGPSSYLSVNHGLANGINSLAQSSKNHPLADAARQQSVTMGTDGFFNGRVQTLPLSNTSTSLEMDEALDEALVTNLTQEDYEFQTSRGTKVTLKGLLDGVKDGDNSKQISQETLDGLGEIIEEAQFTMVPDPATNGYLGMITVPLEPSDAWFAKDDPNATLNLFFPAPKEYHETMRRQGEYEEVIDAELGTTQKVTRPRTALEKAKFDDEYFAQLDIQRAKDVPGDISMSSYEDGEGNPLGYYYYAQDPTGEPIQFEQYVFQPRSGLVKGINPQDGSTIFTTGNEMFNIDSDLGSLSYLIAMNDPTRATSRDFWLQQAQVPSSPIAIENTILNVPSVGLGTDMGGNSFQTSLNSGQTMLLDDRVSETFAVTNNMPNNLIGLQKPIASLLHNAADSYSAEFETVINDKLSASAATLPVTLESGAQISLQEAVAGGYVVLEPKIQDNPDNNNFSLTLASGARTYQQQKEMYDAYVAGGKKGNPTANPANGGFHVLGQAIDLSSQKSDYDWVLSTKDVKAIGNSTVGLNVSRGAGPWGISLSELKGSDGKLAMPNFYKTSIKSLLSHITKSPAESGVIGESIVKDYNMPANQGIQQFDKEWWHLSYGEQTKNPGEYVYPSWAN